MTGTVRPGRGLGLTSRIGSWSFRHPFVAVAIWLVVLAGGVLSAGKVFAGLDSSDGPTSM